MFMMPQRRGPGWTLITALLVLALESACSRPVSVGTGDHPELPFHGDAGTGREGGVMLQPGAPTAVDGVPFKALSPLHLPVGTLLTVRLQGSLSSATRSPGQSFAALVDEPVLMEGRTVIPRNARVRGRVESVRVSNSRRDNTGRDAGCLRLTLDSIRIADGDIPLQTASLFVRGSVSGAKDLPASGTSGTPIGVRLRPVMLRPGRRLTFRLTGALDTDKPAADQASDKP
jgi:hypothetical protein